MANRQLTNGLQWMPGWHLGLQLIAIGPAPLRPAVRRLREHIGILAVQFSMNKIFNLVRMAFPGSFAAALLLAGCATPKDTEEHRTAPVYDTAEQIKAMLPCK